MIRTPHSLLRCAGPILAAIALFGCGSPSFARDGGGLQDFLASQFGFGSAQQEPQPPVWSEDNPYEQPLVVRPRHRKAHAMIAAVPKGLVPPVSMYEDKTLRRGDAVMTARGIRIFKGSSTLPYSDSDFAAVSDNDGLSRDVTKALLAMDHVPRS